MDANKMYREKGRRELHKNATGYIKQILETTPSETTMVGSFTYHL